MGKKDKEYEMERYPGMNPDSSNSCMGILDEQNQACFGRYPVTAGINPQAKLSPLIDTLRHPQYSTLHIITA